MKINKETRQLSKELLRASFVDGRLDNARIGSLVTALIEKKPRNYIRVLEAYQRLLRLEVEKRTATIETASELPKEASAIEHERTMTELKRELGRLVVNTTAKVTGKVLTTDDQKRLQEEAARQIAS